MEVGGGRGDCFDEFAVRFPGTARSNRGNYGVVSGGDRCHQSAVGECSCPRGVATAAAVSGHLVSAAA
ncbi:Uncharacterised protein [Mycobacteroides abscessus subsp. abscessus]|nr:Uncharacterised protein [Mycobacteroides abscessus subsp. abscessus]